MFNESDSEDDLLDVFQKNHKAEIKEINIQPTTAEQEPSSDLEPESKPETLKKKQKLSQDMPIVVDSFEQQAEKEFGAAKVDAETGAKIEEEKKIVLAHAIRHQVALPSDYFYTPIQEHKPLDPPYRSYPFTLDPFQQTAVWSIERNESVLVAAHTSAGKTVVAEYAIAAALKNKQRVIYTSPIKALSNQKYREMAQEFGDVGLMTGDVTINPSASCLVMTTEILRSMMYRGSEIMREVAWVIFDEIHYMRDKARGVVWEETIILLPHKVRYVFLSATIPNAKQFAEWICKIHNQPCHVVYTDFRPTPLQHYVFPAGGDGIHLCVDEKGNFREDNFTKAVSTLASGSGNKDQPKGRKDGKKDMKGQTDLFKIIKMIWTRNYQPVIVFSFSKRDCENFALQMSKLDFNNEQEKEMVTTIYKNAMAGLGENDQELPQIQHLLPLLQRGIGIHHSGLLQILKEVIEILFQEGLIKVLFATETFSIGLNMPAKTVVFTAVTKFDGQERRPLGSGEYIQMSGRAGRRGLDDRGIVILMMDQMLEPKVAKEMLKGQPDRLNSAFHLTYSMILNLMRVEGISPEYILERSFFQFQNNESIPALEMKLAELMAQKEEFIIEKEEEISEYYEIKKQIQSYSKDILAVINHPSYCLPFLQPGRLIKVLLEDTIDFGWCVVLNFVKKTRNTKDHPETFYIVDILAYCQPQTDDSLPPVPAKDRGEMKLIPIELGCIQEFSSVRIFLPKDLKNPEARKSVYRSIQEVHKRMPEGIPKLDPVKEMDIKDETFKNILSKIETLKQKLAGNRLSQPENENELQSLLQLYTEKMNLLKEIKHMKREIKTAHSIMQLDELKYRKRVLRRLEYVTAQDVIELKGRVACEITTGDELVLTELLFNGVFNDLTVEQTVALLSCLVCQEKANTQVQVRSELETPYKLLKETARRIAKVSIESKLSLDEQKYVDDFLPDLMEIVFQWANGASFAEVCKMTDIFEGSIIRMIRRLEELLRQMCSASKQIGNTELEEKFQAGILKIKRDIVFAASLYL